MKIDRREAVLLTLSSIIGYRALADSEPARSPLAPSPQEVERLANQVTIYRDHYGVPHIVGETEEAAFLATVMPRRKIISSA